jgi:hypothetical protein
LKPVENEQGPFDTADLAQRPGQGIPPRRSSLTTWERIFGKSRSSSATRISAPPCVIPT